MCVFNLVKCSLQIWSAHAFSHVFIGRMGQEELLLCKQSCLNILFPINVLLTAVHHPYVTWGGRDEKGNEERAIIVRKTMCNKRKEQSRTLM